MYRIKTQQMVLSLRQFSMWVSKQDNNTSEWENYDFELAKISQTNVLKSRKMQFGIQIIISLG